MTVKDAKNELREYRTMIEKTALTHGMYVTARLNLGMMNFKAGNREITSSFAERMEKAEMRKNKLEKEEIYLIRRSEKIRRTIDRKLNMLSEIDRKILSEKYYKGRSLISLSIEMCYEYTWFCKLHKRALENYASLE